MGEGTMEPISTAMAAFAAVQKVVALIKAANSAGHDVASLGGLIGSYFDAKHKAVKAVREAKKTGGSNLGKAVEIELALKGQRDFEASLKDLFFPNNMDVWASIQERVAQLDQEDKDQEKLERALARQKKRKQDNFNDAVIVVIVVVLLFVLTGTGMMILRDYCQSVSCSAK